MDADVRKKVNNVADEDLGSICFSLEKIRATALSAHSYLDNLICEPNEGMNAVMCMFNVIEDLTNAADNQLTATISKLCAIYKEMEAAK